LSLSTDIALQHDVLEALVDARNYNAWLADLALPHLGDHPVEIGAGIGTYTLLWLDAGVPRLTVGDVEPGALSALRSRFGNDPRVAVEAIDLTDPRRGSHSALVALNVLEHVADDAGALRAGARLVRPGGRIVILVPAFSFAMSRFDRSIGHHRRYTTSSLRTAFELAGLVPRDVRYVNAPGLPAWFVAMRLLRREPRNGLALRLWDASVVPAARAIERRVRPPFGQSVLGVADVVAVAGEL
jgi:SAM-dependent methyltransferase